MVDDTTTSRGAANGTAVADRAATSSGAANMGGRPANRAGYVGSGAAGWTSGSRATTTMGSHPTTVDDGSAARSGTADVAGRTTAAMAWRTSPAIVTVARRSATATATAALEISVDKYPTGTEIPDATPTATAAAPSANKPTTAKIAAPGRACKGRVWVEWRLRPATDVF